MLESGAAYAQPVPCCRRLGEAMDATVQMIAKRRSQMQRVVTNLVTEAMSYLERAPDKTVKATLVETLRGVTAGKLFLELESARLTRMLADMKEEEGDVAGAADILQEVAVETCGSMGFKEKSVYLLEQVRLLIAKKDWVRAKIVLGKMKRDNLKKQGEKDLLLKHCALSIEFNTHGGYEGPQRRLFVHTLMQGRG